MTDLFVKQQYDKSAFHEMEGFDLLKTAMLLGAGWRIIAVVIGACIFTAIIYLHVVQPTYTATIVLSPMQQQNQNIQSSLNGLASMVGTSLGGAQSTSPFALFPYALVSKPVAEDLIQHSPDVMPVIFKDQWDVATGKWQQPSGLLHWFSGAAKSLLGFPICDWTAPGSSDLQQFINKRVKIETSSQKPVLIITFEHENRDFAAHFLQTLYESTDRVLGQITLDRSSKYARYLEKQLQIVQLAEMRQVLLQSLNEQETLVMMGSSNTPFAAQPLGTAVSSIRPTSPNVPIVLLLASLVGLVFGSAVVFLNINLSLSAIFKKVTWEKTVKGLSL